MDKVSFRGHLDKQKWRMILIVADLIICVFYPCVPNNYGSVLWAEKNGISSNHRGYSVVDENKIHLNLLHSWEHKKTLLYPWFKQSVCLSNLETGYKCCWQLQAKQGLHLLVTPHPPVSVLFWLSPTKIQHQLSRGERQALHSSTSSLFYSPEEGKWKELGQGDFHGATGCWSRPGLWVKLCPLLGNCQSVVNQR